MRRTSHEVGGIVLLDEADERLADVASLRLGRRPERLEVAGAEAIGRVRRIAELLEHGLHASAVGLELARVLAVDGLALALDAAGVEERAGEEAAEATACVSVVGIEIAHSRAPSSAAGAQSR